MKKFYLSVVIFILLTNTVFAELSIEEMHQKMLYPVVRVNGGGSGTVIYSKENGNGKHETYILTNHHVIDKAITFEKVWDSKEGEEKKVEKRSVIIIEIFKYKNLSDSWGTLSIKSDIIVYNEGRDLALLKLQSEDKIEYVAALLEKDAPLYVFSDTMAVGCSLGTQPIPTRGQLTQKNISIPRVPYPFHMSQSQIIYGNSGGAMFDMEGNFIGIPSRVPSLGWGGSDPVPHMGLFIPIQVVYEWLDEEGFQKLYDPEFKDIETAIGLFDSQDNED